MGFPLPRIRCASTRIRIGARLVILLYSNTQTPHDCNHQVCRQSRGRSWIPPKHAMNYVEDKPKKNKHRLRNSNSRRHHPETPFPSTSFIRRHLLDTKKFATAWRSMLNVLSSNFCQNKHKRMQPYHQLHRYSLLRFSCSSLFDVLRL